MTLAKIQRDRSVTRYEEVRPNSPAAMLLLIMLALIFLPVAGVWVTAFLSN